MQESFLFVIVVDIMIHFHIISLFPESIAPYLNSSMLGRAQKDGYIKIDYYNPRDFSLHKSKSVDDKPYGGGPGMVLEAPSYLAAVNRAVKGKKNVEYIFFTPSGEQFNTEYAKKLACMDAVNGKKLQHTVKSFVGIASKEKHIVLLCAHYEGLDARVPEIQRAQHLSVGPFVLTGGELPAAIVIDSTARQIDGVLGTAESREEERNASNAVYTRPEVIKYKGKEYGVPEVLLSGHHAKIEEWRKLH